LLEVCTAISKKPNSLHRSISAYVTVLQYQLVNPTTTKGLRILFIFILIFSVYPITHLPVSTGQVPTWTRYYDPGKRFSFSHPPNWNVSTSHLDNSGFTEVTLSNPNSTRMKVSVIYTPKDSYLDSPADKTVVPSRALANLENEMGEGYAFFNRTGKFPHKYTIQELPSASDLIDFEKIEGQPGKMLVVLAKVTDQDSLVIVYSESKRMFYKSLLNVTQIIRSVSIT